MYAVVLDNLQSFFIDFELMPSSLQKHILRAGSYMVKGAQFSKKYQDGKWDGRIYLVSRSGSFPTGIAGLLIQAVKEKGYDVKLEDRISYPATDEFITWDWDGPDLRDYQQEAVIAALAKKRGIISLPTRSGKAQPLYSKVLTPDEVS